MSSLVSSTTPPLPGSITDCHVTSTSLTRIDLRLSRNFHFHW
eukprot:UN10765